MTRFYYSTHHRNFGDALNPFLLERILQIPFEHSAFQNASMVGVGSLLQKCIAPRYAFFRRLAGHFKPEMRVMSTGFIRAVPAGQILIRKLDVRAVRGHETRQIIEKLTGAPCTAAVGDGGLLYPLLLDKLPAKKYAVGIIPHYRDQQLPAVRELADRFKNAVIINVLDEPLEVLKTIAGCERVLSSSLHGLIVADAMGIPNRHVMFSANVTGSDFKFRDYASVFAPEDQLPALLPEEAMTLIDNDLFDPYRSKLPQIRELQQNLLSAMRS